MPLLPGLRHARKPKSLDYKGYTLTAKGEGYDISLDGVKLNGKDPVPQRAVASYVAVRLSRGTKSLVSEELTRMASLA